VRAPGSGRGLAGRAGARAPEGADVSTRPSRAGRQRQAAARCNKRPGGGDGDEDAEEGEGESLPAAAPPGGRGPERRRLPRAGQQEAEG
jgi:hypothetical protein